MRRSLTQPWCRLSTETTWLVVGSSAKCHGRITNDKSLAPYRECRGPRSSHNGRIFGRGTFDRGDLKEVADSTRDGPTIDSLCNEGLAGGLMALREGTSAVQWAATRPEHITPHSAGWGLLAVIWGTGVRLWGTCLRLPVGRLTMANLNRDSGSSVGDNPVERHPWLSRWRAGRSRPRPAPARTASINERGWAN